MNKRSGEGGSRRGLRALSGGAVLAAALAAGACSAATPQRLDEQLALFHDDLRWGRMAAAESVVGGSLRERFVRSHRGWTHRVQVMDLEMEASRVSFTQGTVRTRYVWTGPDGVNIRETVVESLWRANGGGNWYLDEERVVAGDPSMLASGGEGASAAPRAASTSSGGSSEGGAGRL